MGRPSKLTEDLIAQLESLLRTGVPASTAVQSLHVSRNTLYRWKQRAQERPGSIYGTFFERLSTADAEGDVARYIIISNAATRETSTRRIVTKRVMARNGQLVVTEETETETITPPDPKWAAFTLERKQRDRNQQTSNDLPADLEARTIGEQLRILQGGDPNDHQNSYLNENDDDYRDLFG